MFLSFSFLLCSITQSFVYRLLSCTYFTFFFLPERPGCFGASEISCLRIDHQAAVTMATHLLLALGCSMGDLRKMILAIDPRAVSRRTGWRATLDSSPIFFCLEFPPPHPHRDAVGVASLPAGVFCHVGASLFMMNGRQIGCGQQALLAPAGVCLPAEQNSTDRHRGYQTGREYRSAWSVCGLCGLSVVCLWPVCGLVSEKNDLLKHNCQLGIQ